MAKLKVSIHWKGVYYPAGSEAPEGVPVRFTEGEIKTVDKVVAKVSTKEKKVVEEDKNGAPKKRTTKKKK